MSESEHYLKYKKNLDRKVAEFQERQKKKPRVVYVRTKKEIREQGLRAQKKYDLKIAAQKLVERAKREREKLYQPHEKQQIIHNALSPHFSGKTVMVIAGRRFGKTVLAVNEVIDRALELPYTKNWYVAHTKDQAYEVAWRMMLENWIDKEERIHPPYIPEYLVKKKREDKHTIELVNGSLIQLRGIQDELFILGSGLGFVALDEFPAIPWSAWYDTLKPMLVDRNGDALFTGTIPDPKVHDITTKFIDMYEELLNKTIRTKDRAFNFSSYDNPHISKEKIKADIQELERLGMATDAKRLYYGKFTKEYGQVFPKFDYNRHTCEPFKVPPDWTRVMAVDPHPQKPTFALWAAIDPRNHIWFYREAEFVKDGRALTVPEVAQEIREEESLAMEKVKGRLMDPTFAKIELAAIGSKCLKDLYMDYGLFFMEANRNFDLFFHKLSDMLVDIPEPSVHWFRSCPMAIRQTEKYAWEAWASSRARAEKGAKNKPKKTDDDLVDCGKYIINSNFHYSNIKSMARNYQAVLHKRWSEGRIL